MSVVTITIPNFAALEATRDSIISNIETNAPDTLATFLNPRFVFKASNDCSTFYFDDETDYEEVQSVDPNDVSIYVTFVYRTDCGDVCICPSQPLDNNGRMEFSNEMGDGEYCVIIDVEYAIQPLIPGDPIIYHRDRFEECLTQKCCNNNIITLRDNISCTISKIPCNIKEYKKIGRSTSQFEKDYLRLSNMLWLIDVTNQSCEVYEPLNCIYKTM